MRVNRTLAKLAQGGTVFGCAVQCYRSAEIPRLFAAAGFDYVFIDMEHGGFNLETAQDMIAASVGSGITPIVRVGELLYSLVARLLDVGAQGIILPRVEDPRVLEEALGWMRYPPRGRRGFGMLAPFLDYEHRTMDEVMDHLNRNTLSVVQFETAAALDRADELLAVPGIDVAMVGPADLSVSLGIAGQFDHPKQIGAIEGLMDKCARRGIVSGIQTRNAEQARPWVERGMRFVGAGGEHGLLLEAARSAVSQLRAIPLPQAAGAR